MKILLLITALVISFLSQAQSLKGRILDDQGAPLEYVKIKVLKPDSSTISGAFTTIQGNFSVDKLQDGEYIVQVIFPPFEQIDSNIRLVGSFDFGTLKLSLTESIDLDAVVAKGSRDVLKAGIDKKVYDVQDDLTSKGGTVQDLLNNIPSIQVDQDGNISLRGDANVIILIDGRPSALALGDGKNLLSALPANSIERIEVVTNPSAKYDPDGTSGIINIVLKKNKLKGFNGMVSATAATGNQYEGNLSLSYRNSKFNVFGNYSFNERNGYRNYYNQLNRFSGSANEIFLDQQREGTDKERGNTAVLGADFYINERSTLSLSGTLAPGLRERTGELYTLQTNSAGDTLDYWLRNSSDPNKGLNMDFNGNFQRKLKQEGNEWSVNVNHSRGSEDYEANYEQFNYWLGGTEVNQEPILQRLYNKEATNTTTAQFDLTLLYPKINARTEYGAKSIIRDQKVNPRSQTFDSTAGDFLDDTLANYDYAFHFEVHSVYAIFGQEKGKFKYQGGIRAEYAIQAPNLISSNEKYSKEYQNLFPSAHVKYALAENAELGLSYSRRINRPSAGQLNPFTSYADPLNLRSGNPFLEPEYINSIDLSYSLNKKKVTLSLSTFYRLTTDVMTRIKYFYPDNSSIVTFANLDRSTSGGGEIVFIWKPLKWLKNTLSSNGNYIQYVNSDPTTDWNNSGFLWDVKNATVINFWKETASLQINVAYNAPRPSPQGIVQRRGGVDVAFSKSFLSKKLNFVVRTTDVFDNIGFDLHFDRDGIDQRAEYKWQTRRLWFTVSYTFGKFENKVQRSPSREGDSE